MILPKRKGASTSTCVRFGVSDLRMFGVCLLLRICHRVNKAIVTRDFRPFFVLVWSKRRQMHVLVATFVTGCCVSLVTSEKQKKSVAEMFQLKKKKKKQCFRRVQPTRTEKKVKNSKTVRGSRHARWLSWRSEGTKNGYEILQHDRDGLSISIWWLLCKSSSMQIC